MKKNITRFMIAAAALAVAASGASAQEFKAEVPLSFHVGSKLMEPGAYHIRLSMGTHILELYNADTHASAVLMSGVRGDAPAAVRAAGNPAIMFECREGICALTSLWDGSSQAEYRFPGLKRAGGESRAKVVTVTLAKAD